MEENEFHQRQPLLCAELEEHPNGGEEDNSVQMLGSPRSRNGSAIKIEIELPPAGRQDTKFPKERGKTCIALLFVLLNFLLTTASLSITHELRRTDSKPLPDIILDNIPYHSWALDVSEVLIMFSTVVAALTVFLHKHRFILIRRVCVIVGLLYGYRGLTMIVTVLPAANLDYLCDPQLNHTISAGEVAHRVVKIISGFGLSINGQHVYCGDWIFSGHTMILILAYLIVTEYSSRRLWLLHWLLWLFALVGVGMLMMARGHYTVDVVIAYYVTTRIWIMHNTMIVNRHFQQRSATNFLDRLWWSRLAIWFEENVRGPVPPVFQLPLPSFRPSVAKVAWATSKTRMGRARDI